MIVVILSVTNNKIYREPKNLLSKHCCSARSKCKSTFLAMDDFNAIQDTEATTIKS
jgi:hypothetical protein